MWWVCCSVDFVPSSHCLFYFLRPMCVKCHSLSFKLSACGRTVRPRSCPVARRRHPPPPPWSTFTEKWTRFSEVETKTKKKQWSTIEICSGIVIQRPTIWREAWGVRETRPRRILHGNASDNFLFGVINFNSNSSPYLPPIDKILHFTVAAPSFPSNYEKYYENCIIFEKSLCIFLMHASEWGIQQTGSFHVTLGAIHKGRPHREGGRGVAQKQT